MDQEIKEGARLRSEQGLRGARHDHLGAETIHKRLPSVYEIGVQLRQRRHHQGADPVVPTIHYQMGGIPTNIHGQVVTPPKNGNRTRWSTACMRWASAPASACTAPTAWAPTRCSTCWCSAAPPATTSSTRLKAEPQAAAGRMPPTPTLARLARLRRQQQRRIRPGRRQRPAQRRCRACRRVPHQASWTRAWQIKAIAERAKTSTWPTSPGVQHRAHRGAGGREPDRGRAGDDDLGAARKESRGAHTVNDYGDTPTTHPNGRNDGVDEARQAVQRRQPPRLQAVQ